MPEQERKWQPIVVSTDAPPPVGAYSPGVRAGDFIFVSGQVPKDPKSGEVACDDIETQTRQVLANVRAVLEAGGASLDDVVSVIAYLADVDDWPAFNATYKEIFKAPYPTRTALGAQLRGILVEVSAVAYVGARR